MNTKERNACVHENDRLIVLAPRGAFTFGGSPSTVLTGGLDLVDVLQQLLALVDDVKREIVHGQGLIGVVLQPLLGQRQVLRVEVVHLARQLLVPRLQVGDDLRRAMKTQEAVSTSVEWICCCAI